MKRDIISCYLLLQPTLHNVSCDKNKLRPNNAIYHLTSCPTIKMHASSPVAAAVLIIPSLWTVDTPH